MKVFISSVTHLLKEERAALPPFLRLFDHEPRGGRRITASPDVRRHRMLIDSSCCGSKVLYEASLHHRMTGVRRNQVSVVSCSSTN
jgi:hypothetical protein